MTSCPERFFISFRSKQEDDVKIDAADLEQPFLLSPVMEESESDSSSTTTVVVVSHHKECRSSSPMMGFSSLKVLFFVVGSSVALATQGLLTILLWDDDRLATSKGGETIFIFSIFLSLTCLLVFLGVYVLEVYYLSTSCCCTRTKIRKDVFLVLEAYYVVGALASLSNSWFVANLIQLLYLGEYTRGAWVCINLLAVATNNLCLLGFMFQQEEVDEREFPPDSNNGKEAFNHMTTYKTIGGLLGFMFGACSQFFLIYTILYDHDGIPEGLKEHFLPFEILWSAMMPLFAFVGCHLLRGLLSVFSRVVVVRKQGDDSNHLSLLRVEGVYFSSAFFGISIAWIIMEVLMDMTKTNSSE